MGAEKMIEHHVGHDAGVATKARVKNLLTLLNAGVSVGKTVNMAVQSNAFLHRG